MPGEKRASHDKATPPSKRARTLNETRDCSSNETFVREELTLKTPERPEQKVVSPMNNSKQKSGTSKTSDIASRSLMRSYLSESPQHIILSPSSSQKWPRRRADSFEKKQRYTSPVFNRTTMSVGGSDLGHGSGLTSPVVLKRNNAMRDLDKSVSTATSSSLSRETSKGTPQANKPLPTKASEVPVVVEHGGYIPLELGCKREHCRGKITLIGEAAGDAKCLEEALQRQKKILGKSINTAENGEKNESSPSSSTSNARNQYVYHGSCGSCSACGDRPLYNRSGKETRRKAWQRYCALCCDVFAVNGFWAEHGGLDLKNNEKPLQQRSKKHKSRLIALAKQSCTNENVYTKEGGLGPLPVISQLNALEAERKWLKKANNEPSLWKRNTINDETIQGVVVSHAIPRKIKKFRPRSRKEKKRRDLEARSDAFNLALRTVHSANALNNTLNNFYAGNAYQLAGMNHIQSQYGNFPLGFSYPDNSNMSGVGTSPLKNERWLAQQAVGLATNAKILETLRYNTIAQASSNFGVVPNGNPFPTGAPLGAFSGGIAAQPPAIAHALKAAVADAKNGSNAQFINGPAAFLATTGVNANAGIDLNRPSPQKSRNNSGRGSYFCS
eukprot:g1097.t1